MGGGNSKDLIRKIRLISLSNFKKYGSIPRYPDQKTLTISLADLPDRNNCLILFISHVWLRSYKEDEGWDGKPHPDTLKNDSFHLIVEGIELFINSYTKDMKECYLWIDYTCLNQNKDPGSQMKDSNLFAMILANCDAMFTPLYDPHYFTYSKSITTSTESQNIFSTAYQSFAWMEPSVQSVSLPAVKTDPAPSKEPAPPTGEMVIAKSGRSYLSRAWCRLELFASLLIPPPIEDKKEESKMKFLGDLSPYKKQQKRPHFLYGTKEQQQPQGKRSPIFLPIFTSPLLESPLLEQFHPSKGNTSIKKEQKYIPQIWENLVKMQTTNAIVPTVKPTKTSKAVVAVKDSTKEKVNQDQKVQEDSDKKSPLLPTTKDKDSKIIVQDSNQSNKNQQSYDLIDMPIPTSPAPRPPGTIIPPFPANGKHEYHFLNDDLYEGEFFNHQLHGEGKYKYASGDLYEGMFSQNLQHGKGKYTHHSGAIYVGEFQYGLMHGYGKYTYSTGSYYEGEFQHGLMHGKGIYYYSKDQTTYEGEYIENQKTGFGKFLYLNGDIYEGEFLKDHKHGIGYLHQSNGVIIQQNWEKNQLKEERKKDNLVEDGNMLMMESKMDDYDALFILGKNMV